MEMLMVMSFFATAFCAIGMLLHKDFTTMVKEVNEFELGNSKYIVLLVSSPVLWQYFFMGAICVISCCSSLLSGIIIAVLLPVTGTLAVLLYHEKFQIEKALSLVLSLWGFISFFYSELKYNNKHNQASELHMP